MKILITTVREFPDDLFDLYLFNQKSVIPWLDIEQFKRDGYQKVTSIEDTGFPNKESVVTTCIEIIKEGG